MTAPTGRDLARQVLLHVLRHPESHEQDTFFGSYREERLEGIDHVEETPCGTIGCIAGWTVVLGTPPERRAEVIERCESPLDAGMHFDYEAARLLGIEPVVRHRRLGLRRDEWSTEYVRLRDIFFTMTPDADGATAEERAVVAFAELFDVDLDELRRAVAAEAAATHR